MILKLGLKKAIVGSAEYWLALIITIAQMLRSLYVALIGSLFLGILTFIVYWWIEYEERAEKA